MDVVITFLVILVATLDGAKPQVHNDLENYIGLPRVTLVAGRSIDMENIKEGDDLYFTCHIVPNPKVHKVQWFHNAKEISQNVSIGIIFSNKSLVLQQVSESSSGIYTCKTTNPQGSSSSNAIRFRVKHLPHCRSSQTVVYRVGIEEELNITCNIEADPEPNSYRWSFNNSSEIMDYPSDLPWWVDDKGRSHTSYTPHSLQDYGTIRCWATNEVGIQRLPCIYNIIHADDGWSVTSGGCGGRSCGFPFLIIGLEILVVVRSKGDQPLNPEVNIVYEKVAGCPSRDNDEDGGDCDPNPTDVVTVVTYDHLVTTTSETTQ